MAGHVRSIRYESRSATPLRLAVAAAAGLGLLLQAAVSVGGASGPSSGEGLFRFCSYFTVLSNAALVLAVALPRTRHAALLRGGATTAMLLTGLAYHLLLAGSWQPWGVERIADLLLHTLAPAGALALWVAFPPREPLTRLAPWTWTVPVLGYLAAVLAMVVAGLGAPYPFLDPVAAGMRGVLLHVAALLAAFIGLGHGVAAIARRRA